MPEIGQTHEIKKELLLRREDNMGLTSTIHNEDGSEFTPEDLSWAKYVLINDGDMNYDIQTKQSYDKDPFPGVVIYFKTFGEAKITAISNIKNDIDELRGQKYQFEALRKRDVK